MPKITARGGVSALLRVRCTVVRKIPLQRAYHLRKTAGADALPLPLLFDVLGSLKLALKNGWVHWRAVKTPDNRCAAHRSLSQARGEVDGSP
jgi:hypothetical protein